MTTIRRCDSLRGVVTWTLLEMEHFGTDWDSLVQIVVLDSPVSYELHDQTDSIVPGARQARGYLLRERKG